MKMVTVRPRASEWGCFRGDPHAVTPLAAEESFMLLEAWLRVKKCSAVFQIQKGSGQGRPGSASTCAQRPETTAGAGGAETPMETVMRVPGPTGTQEHPRDEPRADGRSPALTEGAPR